MLMNLSLEEGERRPRACDQRGGARLSPAKPRPLSVAILRVAGGDLMEEALLRRGLQTANEVSRERFVAVETFPATPPRYDYDCLFVTAPWSELDRRGAWRENVRRAVRSARMRVGVGAGALVLLDAGYLREHSVATPVMERAKVLELHPDVIFTNAPVSWRGRWASCAGRVTTLDAVTAFLIEVAGRPAVARETSAALLYGGSSEEEIGAGSSLGSDRTLSRRLIHLLQHNVEEPLSTEEIAATLDCSKRTLQRTALKAFGCTLMEQYRRIRLDHARWLLQSSDRTILDVSLACGFPSHSAFSRAFRRRFAIPPSAVRAARSPPVP